MTTVNNGANATAEEAATAAPASRPNAAANKEEESKDKNLQKCSLCSAMTHEKKERQEGKVYQVLPASSESSDRGWMRCDQ